MANNQALFTMHDVSFSYDRGATMLFSGLNLRVREGAITTLIGANGSGKSTLFGLLTKNLKPTAGSVYLRGADVADLRLADFARLVSIVHQRNSAPGDLSVEKLVGYGRYPHRRLRPQAQSRPAPDEDERMVAWALDVTGLSAYAKRPVSALSGGQAQRAWIAMALAQGADVMLLDEPTTFLDVRYQLEVLRLIKRLNREFDKTILMVLHDVNQAIRYSDELVALARGRIVAQGPPADIVTGDLLSQVFDVRLDIAHIKGSPYVLAV